MSPVVLRVIKPRIFTPPQFQDADSEDVVIEDTDSEDGIEPDWPATQDVPYSQDLFQDTPPATQDVTDAEDI